MIPAAFDYVRASSLDEAVDALSQHGDEAKLLAGGHSLLPLMRFRLARPAVVVDIGRLDDLKYIRNEGSHVAIGALTRHRDVETSDVVASKAALLGEVTSHVGDPQVRHRGTIGGSVAHGDPASDIPSALLALGAVLVAVGPDGRREIPVDDFFTGFLETDLSPSEVLTEVRIPATEGAWGFEKFNRRAQDWAIVGVSAAVQADGSTGVGLVNMHATPVRARAVEAALAEGADAAAAAEHAAEGCEPSEDLNAGVDYRQHLARVLTRRALQAAGL